MARLVCFIWIACVAIGPTPLHASPEEARAVAKELWGQDHAIGLRRRELEQACLYIDAIASKTPWQQRFSKKTTHLACDIERTTSPDGFMLTNLPGHCTHLGKGLHKVVKKALFYGGAPKVVAECVSDGTAAAEIAILTQLQGCRGIVPYLGSKSCPNGTYTIYLEYFSFGSLVSCIQNGRQFSDQQKLSIATDVLSGLCSMHERHLVHRDLHPGNILLRQSPSGFCSAALIDFDKTISPYGATNEDLPQAARTRNPPEALIQVFSIIDRYAVDVYAMGCNFFLMEWGSEVPWAKVFSVHDVPLYSYTDRLQMHAQIQQSYEKTRKEKLGAGQTLTPIERFKSLIFEMIAVSPADRPSAAAALRALATSQEPYLSGVNTDRGTSSRPRSVQEASL